MAVAAVRGSIRTPDIKGVFDHWSHLFSVKPDAFVNIIVWGLFGFFLRFGVCFSRR